MYQLLKKTKLAFVILLLISTNAFCMPQKSLTIFAEPNLMMPITKLARIYSKRSNVVVSVNFKSSQELLNNIDQGDPADLFITAHKESIATIKQKGLADYYNIAFFARDKIVLISTNKTNDLGTNEASDFDKYLRNLDDIGATIITDSSGSSSGSNVIKYLDNINLKNLKVFNKIAEDESSVKKLIKSDDRQFGLVFKSQIIDDPEFKILAESKKNDIFYQALVVLGYNMENARQFLKFLKSKTAKNILQESGLLVD